MEFHTCYQLPNSMKHTPTVSTKRSSKGTTVEPEAQKMVGFRVPTAEFERCVAHANEQKRSPSSFIRMLALRGLELYEAEVNKPKSRRR